MGRVVIMGVSFLKVYIGLVVFLIIGVLLPVVIVEGQIKAEMIIFYGISIYSTFRLAKIIKSNKIKMLEMTFFIFVYVFFGLAPLSQVFHNEFPWGGIYTPQVIQSGGLIIIIGIIFYELGIFYGNQNKLRVLKPKEQKINLKLITLVGTSCFIFAIAARGGIQALFLPRNELTSVVQASGIDTSLSLILTVLIRVPVLVALMFAILIFIDRKSKNIFSKSNFILVLLIIALGITTIIANNPISTARYWIGTIYISLLFTVVKWNRMTQTVFLLFILSVLLFVFPYADVFRNSTDFRVNLIPLSQIMSWKGDYDSFQQVMNIVDYVSHYGVTYGMQLLGVFFFWVPRSVWPEKPIGTGATVAEGLGYNFTNVSAPLWSEFYINFGLIGLCLLFFLYGSVTVKLQKEYENARMFKVINFYRVFVPIFAAYQLFLLRGDLLSSFAYIAPVFIFIMIGFKHNIFKKGHIKIIHNSAQSNFKS